ncbi:M1 family metallopeptidase [uncultured Desulfosarcina sp.]|uniref:M1 family metallopeptidase n=1 Tax=uncultured Desulfosarcina sp. TaxID=218289 RepID=UPI0029C78F52|nr:M1 family metallopeptidase [uncultured Desulfosarcina sp.]
MQKRVIPKRYHIAITPDLNDFTFAGQMILNAHAPEPAEAIRLDSLELDIRQCRLKPEDKTHPEEECRFTVNPADSNLTVHFPGPITGDFELVIDYTGKINDLMAGFYRSSIQVAGAPDHMAVTQFQESDARRAFPCFDHLAQKAVFTVEMVIDDHLTAISNADIQTISAPENGRRRVIFYPTPKMSTYLVFFGVGPFEIHRDETDHRVRAVCLPGAADQTRFGREFGCKALAYGEDYFDIAYPLTKLDLIAVPDFAFGAMENWGAITFRENLLLNVPGVTSREARSRICEIIAHEITHQWFGNLVTPEDWKYLWLNESFATYFGYGMVDHYYPEWRIWHAFVRNQTEAALARDALHETFAIEMPGDAVVAINTSTAPIIYSKGGSILRQLEAWIGPERFKSGLRRYLKEFAYDCAASHHLWESLAEASEMPVTELMRSWVTQPGFPLITVRRNGNRLTLRQRRFTCLPNDSDQTWMVPLSVTAYASDGSHETLTVLLQAPRTDIDLPSGTRAYHLNPGHTGFYHVQYADAENLSCLADRVKKRQLPSLDRWGLQNDLFALVKSGELTMDAFLDWAEHYRGEPSYLPLSSLDSHLFEAYLVLQGDIRNRIGRTAMALMDTTLDAIGFEPAEDESQTTAMLRDQLLVHGSLIGNQNILAFLTDRFHAFAKGDPVPPDIFRSVMTAGAVVGGQDALDTMIRRLASSKVEHERTTLATALGAFSPWTDLEGALDYVLDNLPDRIRFMPLVAAAGNPTATHRLWAWFEDHLSRLEKMHPLLFERVVAAFVPVPGLTEPPRTRSFCEQLARRQPRLKNVIDLSLEHLEVNHRFRLREQ